MKRVILPLLMLIALSAHADKVDDLAELMQADEITEYETRTELRTELMDEVAVVERYREIVGKIRKDKRYKVRYSASQTYAEDGKTFIIVAQEKQLFGYCVVIACEKMGNDEEL